MKRLLTWFLVAALAAGAAATVNAAKKNKKAKQTTDPELSLPDPSDEVVWPGPPSPPIIRYDGAYWGDINFEAHRKGKFKQKLLGEKPEIHALHHPIDVAVDSERNRVYVSERNWIGIFDLKHKIYAEFFELCGPVHAAIPNDYDVRAALSDLTYE